MSKSRERQFRELDKLRENLDPVNGSELEHIISNHGEHTTLETQEALYRLATEVAYYRKKQQLGYVQ